MVFFLLKHIQLNLKQVNYYIWIENCTPYVCHMPWTSISPFCTLVSYLISHWWYWAQCRWYSHCKKLFRGVRIYCAVLCCPTNIKIAMFSGFLNNKWFGGKPMYKTGVRFCCPVHALTICNWQQQSNKMHNLFPRYLYYNITGSILTCCDPQVIITIIREPKQNNIAHNQICHLSTFVRVK